MTNRQMPLITVIKEEYNVIMNPLCKILQKLEEQYLSLKIGRKVQKERQEGRTFVYVHTMGKVGSSTLRKSLRSSRIADDLAVYGTYFLSGSGLKFFRNLEQDGFGSWCKYKKPVKYLLCEGEVLSKELKESTKSGERVKVITLARDPIATNVSGFFQNYYWWPKKIINQCQSNDQTCVQDLIKIYFERYPHDVPLTWWSDELKDVFHVNVTESKFPQDKGYEIYHSDIADVLVLKLEQLNECIEEASREFMGLDNFQLIATNTATNKWYAPIYKSFCNTIVFPEEYLNKMYESDLYKNFYSEKELEKFHQKWRR